MAGFLKWITKNWINSPSIRTNAKKQLNTGFSADRLFSFFNKEATDGNRF